MLTTLGDRWPVLSRYVPWRQRFPSIFDWSLQDLIRVTLWNTSGLLPTGGRPNMYTKILVALDRSKVRRVVLDQALSLAQVMGADLMFVHALSAYEHDSPGLPVRAYHTYYPILDSVAWDTYQQRWEAYEQKGLEELQQFAAEARDLGLHAEFTQTAGDPGRIVCDVARSWSADLIIVGHRGLAGIGELLLGSVSNYIMHHAPCSVLVVRGAGTAKARQSASEAATANA